MKVEVGSLWYVIEGNKFNEPEYSMIIKINKVTKDFIHPIVYFTSNGSVSISKRIHKDVLFQYWRPLSELTMLEKIIYGLQDGE